MYGNVVKNDGQLGTLKLCIATKPGSAKEIMRTEHRDIQQLIKRKYEKTYHVAAEADQKNILPDPNRHWYQPDVILWDANGEIRYVIEVENDPVRKALIGASILADYSIGELNQQTKTRLIFVVCTEQGIRQIRDFKEKLNIAKLYCSHLDNIEIYSETDFKALHL